MSYAAIILAAGKGKRMKSDTPKVLHRAGDRYLLHYVIDAVQAVAPERVIVVVGFKAELVMEACRGRGVEFVLQKEQLGTGHAVLQCEDHLVGYEGTVIVMNGDVPGLRPRTIERFIAFHEEKGAAATVLSAVFDDPTGYGRIIKNEEDSLLGIVEEKDAGPAQKLIKEINSGLFCFDNSTLFETLKRIGRDNVQREYYLTDAIEIMRNKGMPVAAFCVDDAMEVAGVNTLAELKHIGDYLRENPR